MANSITEQLLVRDAQKAFISDFNSFIKSILLFLEKNGWSTCTKETSKCREAIIDIDDEIINKYSVSFDKIAKIIKDKPQDFILKEFNDLQRLFDLYRDKGVRKLLVAMNSGFAVKPKRIKGKKKASPEEIDKQEETDDIIWLLKNQRPLGDLPLGYIRYALSGHNYIVALNEDGLKRWTRLYPEKNVDEEIKVQNSKIKYPEFKPYTVNTKGVSSSLKKSITVNKPFDFS